MISRRELESSGIESKTLVDENQKLASSIPSTARHEKPRGNQGGPPPKAKYSLVTDSEPVP